MTIAIGRWRIALVAAGLAAAALGVALSQHWLAAADLLPLAFVLPCALMMIGCMKGSNQVAPGQSPVDDAANPERR